MIIVIIVISLILIIIGAVCYSDFNEFFIGSGLAIGFVALFIALPIMLIAYPYNIDKKLEMYQQENIAIEEKVKNTVQGYMNYEQETYKTLVETAELEMLLIKYPELNSNELVKSEIEIYKENSKKIKELKERKINKDILGWWLYFNIGNKGE